MALTEAEFFPIEYSLREIELARELGSHKISAHAGFGESSRHTRYVERLAAAGALDSDLLLVHGWSLSDHELELMVRHGTTLAVTPETELQMGMGFPALARFAELGGRAGLGIDIVSNQSSDMFTQMRLALQTSRGYDNDRLARRRLFPAHLRMTTEDVLESATIDGAHALGLGHEVGSLTVGKRADLLLIRKRDINMAPVNDAAAAVVLYANTGNIDTVIADGVIRKRHGQLTHPNLDDLIDQLQESTTTVLMRANEFDLAERMHFVRQIFPTDRKSSIEQRLAAKVFRTKAAAPLHDRLIRYLIKRTRIDG